MYYNIIYKRKDGSEIIQISTDNKINISINVEIYDISFYECNKFSNSIQYKLIETKHHPISGDLEYIIYEEV